MKQHAENRADPNGFDALSTVIGIARILDKSELVVVEIRNKLHKPILQNSLNNGKLERWVKRRRAKVPPDLSIGDL